ncbi:MAG: hypothetical protein ISR61_03985 [Desulfobacteraceae bacterium]|nr:hypothetical protein [Desulfobacteraceae bacterium]
MQGIRLDCGRKEKEKKVVKYAEGFAPMVACPTIKNYEEDLPKLWKSAVDFFIKLI